MTADTEHRSPIATLLRDVNLAGVTYSDLAEDAWRAGQVEAAFKWRHVAEGVRIARDRIVAANLPPAHPWVAVMVDVMVDTGRRAVDPAVVGPDGAVEILIVRGSAVPVDGVLPSVYDAGDLLPLWAEFDADDDLGARLAQAMAMADGLNAAEVAG